MDRFIGQDSWIAFNIPTYVELLMDQFIGQDSWITFSIYILLLNH